MPAVIAKNIKLFSLRKEKGWTQIECAEKLGIPVNHYAAIEQGKARGKIGVWCRIQEEFDVPDSEMWELIKGSM